MKFTFIMRWGVAGLALAGAAARGESVAFASDFDGAMPAAVTPGSAELTGVQGYVGLGPTGNQFGGAFLRCPTGDIVTITLASLPAHSSIDIEFLFAAIDSLDGTGNFPQGDFLRVRVDGVEVFRESFANAVVSQVQSYVSAPSVELARRVDLGFSGPGSFYTDSAYNMAAEPRFRSLAHSASTAVIDFIIEGPGIQSLGDESWAMDNLRVVLDAGPTCDPIDFNGDGLFPDTQDIDDFLTVFAGGACPTGACGDIDFNNDGLFPDTVDIDTLLAVFAGGVCA